MTTPAPHPPSVVDANAYRAAQERPVLLLGRYRYTGQLLSIEQWLPFAERAEQLRDAQASPREWARFARDYFRAVFPRWRRSPFWAPDPVPLLMREPFGFVMDTLDDFFGVQLRATTPSPKLATAKTTPGSDSPARTAASTSAPTSSGAASASPSTSSSTAGSANTPESTATPAT